MSSNNTSTHSRNAPPSGDNVPYTITEQAGKIKVVFISGPQKGDNFEIPRPQTLGTGESSQTKQLEVESSVSYLDGNGNKISEEEFERLSAIEIAEEEAREGGGGVR
jgi:phage portal protein BeeE